MARLYTSVENAAISLLRKRYGYTSQAQIRNIINEPQMSGYFNEAQKLFNKGLDSASRRVGANWHKKKKITKHLEPKMWGSASKPYNAPLEKNAEKRKFLLLKIAKELTVKQRANLVLGATSVGIGATQIGKAHRSGALTGRETFWHATESKNVKNIKVEGLKSKFSIDPTNLTNTMVQDISMSKKKGKIYLGRKRSIPLGIKAQAAVAGVQKKIIKVRLSLEEVAKRETINPELRGAKTKKQFMRRAYKAGRRSNLAFDVQMDLSPKWLRKITARTLKSAYKGLSSKGTLTYKGDIASKNIVGGKGYKATKFKDVIKHIKKRPAMFAKGVARVGAGAGLIAAPLVVKHVMNRRNKLKLAA